MSANLDKSLDEIISSKPRAPRAPRGRSRRTVAVRKGVSKSAAPSAAKKAVAKKAAPAAAPKLNVLDEASKLADRIIISNLPTDVSETAVRNYFQHEVGPISQCQISYNSKGQSTGVVTITFKNPGHAHKASVRFNGTSIDNGAKFMKVELVMDPSKKPLSSRLNPAPSQPKGAKTTKASAPRAKTSKAEPSKPKATKARAPRRPKKTLEELDAEMADYFDNKA